MLWVQSLASLSGLDLALLWLWPATTVLIRPLVCEPPYAAGAALERQKKKKKKKKKKKGQALRNLCQILSYR